METSCCRPPRPSAKVRPRGEAHPFRFLPSLPPLRPPHTTLLSFFSAYTKSQNNARMQRARGFLHQSRMAGGDEKQSFAGPQLRSKSRGLGTRLGAFRTTQKHAGADSSKTPIKDAKGVADKRSGVASEGGDRIRDAKQASRNDESKERSEEDGSEASSDDDPTVSKVQNRAERNPHSRFTLPPRSRPRRTPCPPS